MEVINLLVTIDKNYLQPLCVMLKSYEQTHTGVKTNVYVAHSSLTEADFSLLNGCISDTQICIHSIKITEKRFNTMPVLERLGAESFYRILAFSYLPKEIKRCLYLDPDILIRRSLLEMYYTDLTDKYLAAASHIYGFNNFFNLSRLGIWSKSRYINSGIMLMNLEEIRKDFTVEVVFSVLKKKARILFMGDQDLCNILFGKKMVLLDELLYNLDERTLKHNRKIFNLKDVENKTVIIHYNGKNKPWLKGYKGDLDRFYPDVEKVGDVVKFNALKRFVAIIRILFLIKNKNQKKVIHNEKIISY